MDRKSTEKNHRQFKPDTDAYVERFDAFTQFASASGSGRGALQRASGKRGNLSRRKWQRYVTDVGERLLAVSSHADKTYTFFVVDEPIVNAWATPDAYIFVTRGILAYFQTEDELANVLGHEIAHVILWHSKAGHFIADIWNCRYFRSLCDGLGFRQYHSLKALRLLRSRAMAENSNCKRTNWE